MRRRLLATPLPPGAGERGASAVEYALLIAAVAVLLVPIAVVMYDQLLRPTQGAVCHEIADTNYATAAERAECGPGSADP